MGRIMLGAFVGGLAGLVFGLLVLALVLNVHDVDPVRAFIPMAGWLAGTIAGSITEATRALIKAMADVEETNLEALSEATKAIVHAIIHREHHHGEPGQGAAPPRA